MNIKAKKVLFLAISIALTLSISGCKLSLKAGVIKHEKKAVELKEQSIDYKDELDYIQSSFETLEKSLLASEIDEDLINDSFKGFTSEIEIESQHLYFTTENNGKMFLHPESPLPEGYDGRTRPWYVQAKENTVYLSEPYKDVKTGENILTYAKALYKDDVLLGVVGIDIVIK